MKRALSFGLLLTVPFRATLTVGGGPSGGPSGSPSGSAGGPAGGGAGPADHEEHNLVSMSSTCAARHLPPSHSSNKVQTIARPGRPDRSYYIYTPSDYDPTIPSKVLLAFHGWGGHPSELLRPSWVRSADRFNYVVVAPEGLGQSWKFPGSSDGIGRDGDSVTTCDTNLQAPDSCYDSCAPCPSRCGWTHCQDDDIAFVVDLIADLQNHLCVDSSHIYSFGISNGGMLTWSMGQDARTAPLLAGLAPVIGLPHYDYRVGKASSKDLPVIGIYGTDDIIVPPGDFEWDWAEDNDGYYYMSAHRMHTTWAMDHGCNPPPKKDDEDADEDADADAAADPQQTKPLFQYDSGKSALTCRTHCSNDEHGGDDSNHHKVPFSVDCRATMGHIQRAWNMEVALRFFEEHNNAAAAAAAATVMDATNSTSQDAIVGSTSSASALALAAITSPTNAPTGLRQRDEPQIAKASTIYTATTDTTTTTTEAGAAAAVAAISSGTNAMLPLCTQGLLLWLSCVSLSVLL